MATPLSQASDSWRQIANPLKAHTKSGTVKEFQQYPFMPFSELERRFKWERGQHILTVGGTGSGKTTLSAKFLKRRTYVVVCVSKGADETFAKEFSDYEIIRKWPPPRDYMHRVLLWPENKKTTRETRKAKQDLFRHTFDTILLKEGNWCIDIDELHYMADALRLEPEITDLEEQGRSNGISIWGNTQRPAGIPLACYTNASHGFFYLTQEEYDVRRLASMAPRGTSAVELDANIRALRRHEFVYIDRYGTIPPVRSIVDLRR